jgi:isocitrate lyase
MHEANPVDSHGTDIPETRGLSAERIQKIWTTHSRWAGVTRNYTAEEMIRLRPSLPARHTIAEHTSRRLWRRLAKGPYLNTFGALTGAQAVQMVRGGLESIYLSGWQVAADMNLSGQTYPDQSLYPSNSVPQVVARLNNALTRADQVERTASTTSSRGLDWYVPIVADAEAGFGGPLHAFELMKSMLTAGAAGVHFEDQLAAEKKCGHLGGKVLVPASQFIRSLQGARLAADVLDVPAVLVARTDALSATLLTTDLDELDRPFMTGERTSEGFYVIRGSLEYAIARALAYAPHADVLWFETSRPDLQEAKAFADAIHRRHPGKILAYNCSPSFNWKKNLSDADIARFQRQLGDWGYQFQFITLAGWHLINYHTFDLAADYAKRGMPAYVELQEKEFGDAAKGYTAVRHQQEVGTGYFDSVLDAITQGQASTGALEHSTEDEQFVESPTHPASV